MWLAFPPHEHGPRAMPVSEDELSDARAELGLNSGVDTDGARAVGADLASPEDDAALLTEGLGSETDADEMKHAPPGERTPAASKGSPAVGQTMLGVTLHWGNEYARWHTKRLTFQVAVISKLALTRARRRHGELREASLRRDHNLEALQHAAGTLSTALGNSLRAHDAGCGDDASAAQQQPDLASSAFSPASMANGAFESLSRTELIAALAKAQTERENLASALALVERTTDDLRSRCEALTTRTAAAEALERRTCAELDAERAHAAARKSALECAFQALARLQSKNRASKAHAHESLANERTRCAEALDDARAARTSEAKARARVTELEANVDRLKQARSTLLREGRSAARPAKALPVQYRHSRSRASPSVPPRHQERRVLKSAANKFRETVASLRDELERERQTAAQRIAEALAQQTVHAEAQPKPPRDEMVVPPSTPTPQHSPSPTVIDDGGGGHAEPADAGVSNQSLSLSEQICDLQSRIDSELAARRRNTEPAQAQHEIQGAGERPVRLQITVPEGGAPGMELEFDADGRPMSLVIPPDHWPGDVFWVEI